MNAKVIGILLLLIVLCGFLSVVVPESFLTGNNIENLLRRTAMYGVLGIGVAFVIITSGIDLSIGSIVCLMGCLLAVFLHVDYAPFDQAKVVAVKAQAKQIVLQGEVNDFQAGDRIRYYGGRRARNALLKVTAVQIGVPQESDGKSINATVLTVDEPLTNDDRSGRVASFYDVLSFDADQGSIVIRGSHPDFDKRDQVTLVHPESGLKQLVLASAEVSQQQTRIQLKGDLGTDFSLEWLAIPVQRHQRCSIVVAILLVLGSAVLLGLLHGLLVTYWKLQPFVVTLCGLLFYRGISRWLVDDQVQGFGEEYNNSLSILASGKLMISESFGIPYPFFIMLFVAILASVFLNKTIWGRYMQALGRNEDAARYSGINTSQVTVLAYIICTGLAAVGGLLFALDANSVSPSSFGNFFELYAIAAAVLGGCSLRGGEGGIFGVVIGTAVMQTLYNLIVLLKISDKLEFAIIGAVILAGVMADELLQRVAARRRAAKSAAGS
ncbi:MAG: ABC transporter permease [Pirellulaceae bacterium]